VCNLYPRFRIGYALDVRLRCARKTCVFKQPAKSGLSDFLLEEGKPQMKTAIVKTLTVAAAALMLATASGCSNKELLTRIDAADAAAKAAATDAAAAKSAADAAAASASSAANAASGAQNTANQALQASQASQSCCDATNEKIDRAFKRSMGK
jgi:hypothetical protein